MDAGSQDLNECLIGASGVSKHLRLRYNPVEFIEEDEAT